MHGMVVVGGLRVKPLGNVRLSERSSFFLPKELTLNSICYSYQQVLEDSHADKFDSRSKSDNLA